MNGTDRVAVAWTDKGKVQEGVYIPRRDTSSKLNALAGGRIFPGTYHLSNFTVDENQGNYHVKFVSDDGTFLSVSAKNSNFWNPDSFFRSVENESEFFENGAVGYSPDNSGCAYNGLELRTKNWKVSPMTVTEVRSSFFRDTSIFPKGSVTLDNTLPMQNIEHEWHSMDKLTPSENNVN